MRIWVMASVAVMMSGCAQFDATSTEPRPDTSAKDASFAGTPVDLSWVDYADPVADANLAAAKENFNLLAFGQKGTQLPGVDLQQFSLDVLRDTCGFSFVQGMGDTLRKTDDLPRRKQVRAYAEAFNQVMISECLKHTSL